MSTKSVLRTLAGSIPQDAEICRIAQHIVAEAMAPAVSICVATNRSGGWLLRCGTAGTLGGTNNFPVSPKTPFDLASLTKPLVAVTTATLAHASGLRLSRPIADWLPEFADTPHAKHTIENLLSHRAGLRPHIELFASCRRSQATNRMEVLRQIARRGWIQQAETGASYRPIYSDLGYLLVGMILERCLNRDLDQIVSESLCTKLDVPIASSRQWRTAVPEFNDIVAPTEHVPWRGGLRRGEVHDENAWVLAGYGLAGHAGLFGTAAGVARFGCAVLDSIVSRNSVLNLFATRYCTARRPGGTLRAGFDGKASSNSSAGTLLGPESFGHLGFTGTSLWCDPARDLVIALLTNRVCPSRKNTRLVSARGFLHDCLVRAADT